MKHENAYHIFCIKHGPFVIPNFLITLRLIFLNEEDNDRGRTPRFLRQGLRSIIRRINKGKNQIVRTYTKQFLANWKINYEFVYKAYFMKIQQMVSDSTEG